MKLSLLLIPVCAADKLSLHDSLTARMQNNLRAHEVSLNEVTTVKGTTSSTSCGDGKAKCTGTWTEANCMCETSTSGGGTTSSCGNGEAKCSGTWTEATCTCEASTSGGGCGNGESKCSGTWTEATCTCEASSSGCGDGEANCSGDWTEATCTCENTGGGDSKVTDYTCTGGTTKDSCNVILDGDKTTCSAAGGYICSSEPVTCGCKPGSGDGCRIAGLTCT